MSALNAIWKNGQVILDGQPDWPEGRRLIVLDEPRPPFEFMTEEEQGDDPESIRKWIDDLRSMPPLPEDPVAEAEWNAWQAKMRAFNIEAMRKQFEEMP